MSAQSGQTLYTVLQVDQGEYISVKCGFIEGKLFFDKLKDVTGNLGSIKCVNFNDVWLTTNEFEVKGGKSEARYWKRSITYNGKPLQMVLPALEIDQSSTSSQAPGASSSS